MQKTHSFSDLGTPREVSKSGFAQVVGVSGGRVSQMIAQGLPVEENGKIDVARGKLWIAENIDPRRSAAQPQGELSFEKKRTVNERERLAREQADNVALKNAALRRELLPADDVEAEWSGILRRLRSRILAVPSRLRQTLPHLTASDFADIDAELRRALEDIADA